MKKRIIRIMSLLLVFAMLLPLTACGGKETATYDGAALVKSLLEQVAFADTLSNAGDAAALYFSQLPEGASVELYIGSGYYADEVALITLEKESDSAAAKTAAESHLSELRSQFANYIPEEVTKIDDAVIWQGGKYVIVCVTEDSANAKLILDHAADPDYKLPGSSTENNGDETSAPSGEATTPSGEATTPSGGSTQPSDGAAEPPATTVPVTTVTPTVDPSVETRPDGYPAIQSQSGTYSSYSGTSLIRVDNSAFEICGYSDSVVSTYAELVNKVADALAGKTKVYSLAIPTAFGVMLPDDIQAIFPNYTDQGESIEKLIAKFSDQVTPIRCYDNLMRHRNEYLYFRTDHHWNGIGAYYAYEAFCETKGLTPYTMAQRQEKQFGDFLGTHYSNSGEDANLLPADTVYAYKPYSSTASMVFYDKNGTETKWSIIADVTGWKQGAKYSTFAGADNPLSVFTNPEVTDGSVCIVVKESYGNALLPYLVDHYSTIYEIDYRYWTGDLATYAQEVGADDLIFANNIMMISTSVLVAKLSNVIH